MAYPFTHELLSSAYSYSEYKTLLDRLLEEGKTTGNVQTEKMVGYAMLNRERMKRVEKRITLQPELIDGLQNLTPAWYWVVLAEGWCGDVAQNLPIIAKMADAAPSIELVIFLRDANSEMMDAYLTNGSRSIPKLICLSRDTLQELGTWGPRPAPPQEMMMAYKRNPLSLREEVVARVHKWYALDKGQTLQAEMMRYIEEWQTRPVSNVPA